MLANDRYDRKTLHRRAVMRTVALYAIFASLWIYFSDTVLTWFLRTPEQLTRAQTFKGWLFVLVTATLLYLYLHHCLQTLRSREEELDVQQDRHQRELEDRFKQLNTLFDAMHALVYVADLDSYELLYANRFAEDYFGKDWQGKKCYEYLQQGIDQPCDFCTNPQLITPDGPGASITWEFLNTRNNRWYECYDKAIRWPDGRLVRLEVALDITERKELQQIKDDLLSSMSHEMRTPLTAISGFTELLLNEPDVPEHIDHYIAIIDKEADKLTELVDNFLEVRRLKIDRARVNYEFLKVGELLKKAQESARDCKTNHRIRIECDPDAKIYGNRRELGQVVSQLLANACRYSPAGGEILLRAGSTAGGTSISVCDRGIGIPKHELEDIFKPFHRLDTGNRRKTGGVGLGLSLAREIVVLHGGQIRVDSTPGEGSSFTILLPLPNDPGRPAQVAAAGIRTS